MDLIVLNRLRLNVLLQAVLDFKFWNTIYVLIQIGYDAHKRWLSITILCTYDFDQPRYDFDYV